MRVIHPLARETLSSRGCVLLVDRNLSQPFQVGEVVADASSSKFKILSIEGTMHPHQLNLVVERVT